MKDEADIMDHGWVHEHIGAALAGGLSAEEQGRFDAHINACADCFDAFTEARDADRGMQRSLSGLVPSAEFEKNLVALIREKTMHKRFRPIAKRAGMAIAAAVALAVTGVSADVIIHQGTLNNPITQRLAADADNVLPPLEAYLPLHEKSASRSANIDAVHAQTAQVDRGGFDPGDQVELRSFGDYNTKYNTRKNYTTYSFSRDTRPSDGSDSSVAALPFSDAEGLRYRYGVRILDTNHWGDVDMKLGRNVLENTKTLPGEINVNSASKDVLTVTGGIVSGRGGVVTAGGTPIALNGDNSYSGSTTVGGGTLALNGGSSYYKPVDIKGLNIYGSVEGGYTFDSRKTDKNTVGGLGDIRDREAIQGTPYDVATVPMANTKTGKRDVEKVGFGDGHVDYAKKPSVGDVQKKLDTEEHIIPVYALAPATQPAGGSSAAQSAQNQSTEIAPLKIIRNGEVEFEVRSFDDAYATIAAVTEEEKGYVSSTSSEKLANGKIRGSVVVRVPPERLDRLLLKLRALGDLKSQQIAANDVTKQYTDIESELKALRAMESRLIDLIKNGKGEVKDLVVAEKQLGEYRVRIEKLEGDIRYYNNLVGMATLTITAFEKDIQKPTAAFEQENVTLGLETEDVEGKYRDARKILDEAKGRIVESELKKYDADQYSARIVVDVPADKTDFVAGQLKQIGKVATYNRDRKQTTSGGTGVPTVQVEEKDTRFTITLYNLANVAPRETAVLTVAVRDVEGSYRKVLGLVRQTVLGKEGAKEGPVQVTGRVVSSSINGQQPDQMTADIRADVRAEQADAILQAIRETGEVVVSTSAENPDTANVTSAKRGIQLRLVNIAAVPARETRTLRLAAESVPEAYGKLLATVQEQAAGGGNVRIITSQLTETDPRTITAGLTFEARREVLPLIEKAFADAGVDVLSRNIVRSSDTANTLDSKILFQIPELVMADSLPARRTTTLGLEVDNVEKALDTLRGSLPAGVKEIDYTVAKEASGRVTGRLVIEVPVGEAMSVYGKIKDLGGTEKVNQVVKNTQVPETRFAKERFELTLGSREGIVGNDKGFGATVRAALSTAVGALLYSVYLIIIGVLFAGPWVVIGWAVWRMLRRRKAAT